MRPPRNWKPLVGYLVGAAVAALLVTNQRADADASRDFQQHQIDTNRELNEANAKLLASMAAQQAVALDAVCEADAHTRQGLADVVAGLSMDVPVNPDDHSDSANRTRLSNFAKAGARQLLAETLPPESCADGVPPTPRALPSGTPGG